MDMIVTEDLRKTYQSRGNTVQAVKGVSLRVRQGEIFGFLGPNGAGKTTTMRVLTTLLPPSGGAAQIVGHDLAREARQIRQDIGYVSQKGGCYELATGLENLILQGRLYGLSKAAAMRKADELVQTFHMEEYCRRKVKTYSGGQRRHIDLGMGIMHDPKLLFLDEPTTGLDPTSRANFWAEIRRLRERGITVFLTTHYLDEADSLCDTICIMDHGTVAAQGTALELKRQVAGDVLTIGMAAEQFAKAEELLRGRPDVKETRRVDGALKVYVEAGEQVLPKILPTFVQENIVVTALEMTRPSLDEVFLKTTGRSLRKDTEGGTTE